MAVRITGQFCRIAARQQIQRGRVAGCLLSTGPQVHAS